MAKAEVRLVGSVPEHVGFTPGDSQQHPGGHPQRG